MSEPFYKSSLVYNANVPALDRPKVIPESRWNAATLSTVTRGGVR